MANFCSKCGGAARGGKGDSFFLLGFQQFVPGREKTTVLARAAAGRW